MEQIYISPEAELTDEQAHILGVVAEALYPYVEEEHRAFQDYTSGMRPHTMIVGQYLRLDRSLYVLDNYRSLLVEMVEDFEALGHYVVQLSETMRALNSIQEQLACALHSLVEIDMEVFANKEYAQSLSTQASKLFSEGEANAEYKQLELQL
jgi:hypothetical protein